MKVLYVGDGSQCRINWGAQATSEALRNLLAKEHEVTGVISSLYKLPMSIPVLYSSILPAELLEKPSVSFKWQVLWKLFGKILKKDFVTPNPEESVRNFMELKSKYPKLEAIYSKVVSCDAVVLNGEGTMILSSPPKRWAMFFLFILKLAKDLGKKTYFVNGMISNPPIGSRDPHFDKSLVQIFGECDGVSVRDRASYKLLQKMAPELEFRYIPDALFSWVPRYENGLNYLKSPEDYIPSKGKRYDFMQPYICISGSSAAAKLASRKKHEVVGGYVELVTKLKKIGLPLFLVPTCSGDDFLHDVSKITNVDVISVSLNIKAGAELLANARVFVSGRFHPSIMASLGGTPCVFLKSNSHKTLSLQEVLGYPSPYKEYNAIPTSEDADEILKQVQSILSEGEGRRQTIMNTVYQLSDETNQILTLVR